MEGGSGQVRERGGRERAREERARGEGQSEGRGEEGTERG